MKKSRRADSPRLTKPRKKGSPMASNEYRFVTAWRIRARVKEVADILEDVESMPRWWPAVYQRVEIVRPGDQNGVGKLVQLRTRGWLPYRLNWSFLVTDSNSPDGFSIEAFGDFVGTGVWHLWQEGKFTMVTFDWQIKAEKPILQKLSFILKPIFAANHRWAMARGEESLRLEVRRRNARLPSSLAAIPDPPKEAKYSGWVLAGGALLGIVLVRGLIKKRKP